MFYYNADYLKTTLLSNISAVSVELYVISGIFTTNDFEIIAVDFYVSSDIISNLTVNAISIWAVGRHAALIYGTDMHCIINSIDHG